MNKSEKEFAMAMYEGLIARLRLELDDFLKLHRQLNIEEESAQRDAVQLVKDELNGWMPEFYEDLPKCIGLIYQGVTGVSDTASFFDTWTFFVNLVDGINEMSGNFCEGFSDADRKAINDEVRGNWLRAAGLVEKAISEGVH